MSTNSWKLIEYRELVSLIKLDAGSELPTWADGLPFTTVIWTARETTVICPTRCIPDSPPGTVEGPFGAFELVGELDLTAIGVLDSLITPLAEAQVPVLAYSTFASQWLLIAAQSCQAALATWGRNERIVVHVRGALSQPPPPHKLHSSEKTS